jgi:hypothetical protein
MGASSGFGDADRRNFLRACLVAGAVGMFSAPNETDQDIPLTSALEAERLDGELQDEEASSATAG